MSEKYISVETAVALAMQYCPDDDGVCSKAGHDLRELLDDLENTAPADVRPVVYARWIEIENPDYSPFDPTSQEYELLCSACGATHRGADRNFCPNCGADMRREEEL